MKKFQGNKLIPVQVPAIETCFMSIDEIAGIFSKSHSPYIGGGLRIFPSPKASGNMKDRLHEEPRANIEGNMRVFC